MYHNSFSLFKKTFLPYTIANFLLFLVGPISSLSLLLINPDFKAIVFFGIAGLLSLGILIWGLVLSVSNGKKYNYRLYHQTGGTSAKVPQNKMPPLLYLTAVIVIELILGIVAAIIGNQMAFNNWINETNFDHDIQYSVRLDTDTNEVSGNNDDLYFPQSELSQISGWDLDKLPSPPESEIHLYLGGYPLDYEGQGFDSYCLWGDESVTLGELFTEMFDSYSWNYPYEQGQGTSLEAVCQKGNQTIVLRMDTELLRDEISIDWMIVEEPGIRINYSNVDSAHLLYGLCQEYHIRTNTQAYALAKDIQGTWINADGSIKLEINDTTYGGDSYSIIAKRDGKLVVSIGRKDGTFDERWLELSEDILYVYDSIPQPSPIGELGELIDTFMRAS